MLLAMTSRFVCNIASQLYPAYASYKALTSPSPYTYPLEPYTDPSDHRSKTEQTFPSSRRRSSQTHRPYPLTENPATGRSWTKADKDAEIERWLMYWAVVGTWAGVEGVGWWLLSWIPFYSLFKCMVFLWLSLPQTQGSTVIFNTFLAPFFDAHEGDIDAALAEMRSRAGGAIWNLGSWSVAKIGEIVSSSAMGLAVQSDEGHPQTGPNYSRRAGSVSEGYHGYATSPQPPTMQDPVSGVMQQAYSFGLHYASRYLPLAASALQSASMAAATSAGVRAKALQGQRLFEDRLEMPEPVPPGEYGSGQPTPSTFAGRRASSSNTLRHAVSGTFATGIQQAESQSGARIRSRPDRTSVSSSGSDHEGGSANTQTAGSFKGSRPTSGTWGGASGYEEITREEVVHNATENVNLASITPPHVARSSSWFAWGASADKVKAD